MYCNMYYSMSQDPSFCNYGSNVQQSCVPSPVLAYNTAAKDARMNALSLKRQEDERSIESFLQEVENAGEIGNRKRLKEPCKIAIAKDALVTVSTLNKKLKCVCNEMKENKDMPQSEWQEKINVCNELKQQISEILNMLQDETFVAKLKKDIEKRKKKRLREKLRREKLKTEKMAQEERRARLHAEADSWIRKEQAVIEKEKQDENLRKDADTVLSDVRAKKSDARKYLKLLQELQNLRNVKSNIAKARGEHLSSAADEAFNNIIGKLKEQWATLNREYSIEEKGLKLMLKTDNEKRLEKQNQHVYEDWETVLFGKKLSRTNQFCKSFTDLVMMRTIWDRLINYGDHASAIPIGWIVPDKPSSAAWQKYLKKEAT